MAGAGRLKASPWQLAEKRSCTLHEDRGVRALRLGVESVVLGLGVLGLTGLAYD